MASAIPAVVGGALNIFGAKKKAKADEQAAQAATPVPYSVFGPAGGFGVNGRQLSLTQAQNPFANMFNVLGAAGLANAGAASPEIMRAYQGLFGRGLDQTVQNQFSRLQQLAAPQELRDRQALDTQLFSRGQLGTTGGAERFRALMEAQGQAGLARQLEAVNLGQQVANQRFNAAMGNQMQQFNIGQGAFGGLQNLFQNLIQQGSLGIAAGRGATPGDVALASAGSQGLPLQAGYNLLNQSGAFDRLGQYLGNWRTPPINPPQFQFNTNPRTLPIQGI